MASSVIVPTAAAGWLLFAVSAASRVARYERKFPVPADSIALIREWIDLHLRIDPHGEG